MSAGRIVALVTAAAFVALVAASLDEIGKRLEAA
jgi:hypothetical protein